MKQLPSRLLWLWLYVVCVNGSIDCDTACGVNRVQVCHFNGVEFQTLCIRQNSVLRKAHHTSAQDYCGPCISHKPFESNEELREAVTQYVDANHFDVDLATKYGWPINQWNVSLISDFSQVFANSNINEDIGDWDVSQATNMDMMFWQAHKLEDGGLWKWDVRRVTSMERMFFGASKFNGDIGDWDTRSVTSLMGMFWKASKFNQDLSLWDTSKVRDVSRMFADAASFNQDLLDWDTHNLRDLSYMFLHANSFAQDLASWQLPNAITLERMFYKVPHYQQSHTQTALLTSWRRQWAQAGRAIDSINLNDIFFSESSFSSSSSYARTQQQAMIDTAYMMKGPKDSTHILHLKAIDPSTSTSFEATFHQRHENPNEPQEQHSEDDLSANKTKDCITGDCPNPL